MIARILARVWRVTTATFARRIATILGFALVIEGAVSLAVGGVPHPLPVLIFFSALAVRVAAGTHRQLFASVVVGLAAFVVAVALELASPTFTWIATAYLALLGLLGVWVSWIAEARTRRLLQTLKRECPELAPVIEFAEHNRIPLYLVIGPQRHLTVGPRRPR